VVGSTGGAVYGVKWTSAWSNQMTTTFVAAYNNKRGSDANTYANYVGTGPDTIIHKNMSVTGGRAVGDGRLVEGGNLDTGSGDYPPAPPLTAPRGFAYLKTRLRGATEVHTRLSAAPRS